MEAILFVGHGSRDPAGNEELLQFTQRVGKRLQDVRGKAGKDWFWETSFIEFAQPDVEEGITRCVARGATRLLMVPLILFAAGHYKEDIPQAMAWANENYPWVELRQTPELGVNRYILSILQDRLRQAGFVSSGEERSEAAVLLVGRGSSDAEANSELYKMSRLFYEATPVSLVENAFMGITGPTLAKGVERCVKLGAPRIYVLPYFLFTGILLKRMEGELAQLAEQYGVPIVFGGHLGDHPLLEELVLTRIAEVS